MYSQNTRLFNHRNMMHVFLADCDLMRTFIDGHSSTYSEEYPTLANEDTNMTTVCEIMYFATVS